jgi:glycosyltransferase involved in cell wall biosynthesis
MESQSLKIAMVLACPFPANHGTPGAVRELSEELVAQGHEIHVITYPIKQDIPVKKGVFIHRVKSNLFKPGKIKIGPSLDRLVYDPLMIIKLIQVIRKHDIDVINSHNYEAAIIGFIAKLVTRKPMLYTAINSMSDELHTYDFIKPKFLAKFIGHILDFIVPRFGDLIATLSDDLKDFLISNGVSKDKILVVPAGVDPLMFANADGEKIRKKHGYNNIPIVMYTGALEQFQRVDYLMKAMNIVLESIPSAKLVIVGNVFNERAIQKQTNLIKDLGIDKQVDFIHNVSLDDLPDYLDAADVAVVPRPECPGHPIKLLNYMAAKKAIVSFMGSAKGLHHMHSAYIAPNHDWKELGQGIKFLLKNPEIRDSLSKNAQRIINGNFDWNSIAKGTAIIYEFLINGDIKSTDTSQLSDYLNQSYRKQFIDRRNKASQNKQNSKRKENRRKKKTVIQFIERRKVGFPKYPEKEQNIRNS